MEGMGGGGDRRWRGGKTNSWEKVMVRKCGRMFILAGVRRMEIKRLRGMIPSANSLNHKSRVHTLEGRCQVHTIVYRLSVDNDVLLT